VLTAVALPAVVLLARADGLPAARAEMSAGGAWLASPSQGIVTLIDGASEQVVGSVRAPAFRAGDDLSVPVRVDADRTVTIVFAPLVDLTVAIAGTGAGSVSARAGLHRHHLHRQLPRGHAAHVDRDGRADVAVRQLGRLPGRGRGTPTSPPTRAGRTTTSSTR
jgi:hypothetical protein